MNQEEFEKLLRETIKEQMILSISGAMIIERILNGITHVASVDELIDEAREIM